MEQKHLGYAWFGEYKQFVQNYTMFWQFLEKNKIIPPQTLTIICDENTNIKNIPCCPEKFKQLTEYNISDIINQKCSIFQLHLSPENRVKNYESTQKVMQAVKNKTYCNVTFLQATKTPNGH